MKKLLAIGILLLSCWSAQAATVYVDTGCTNGLTTYVPATRACTGGSATVFSSIPNGWNGITGTGNLIYVRTGTYVQMLFHNFGVTFKSGAVGAYNVMRAYTGDVMPIIRPATGATQYRVIDFNAGISYIEIDGFDLDGVNVTLDVIKINKGAANHITIKNCKVHNAPGNGILGGDTGDIYSGNEIYDNGSSVGDHGIYRGGPSGTIEDNLVHDNAGYGIHLFAGSFGGSGQGCNDNIVRRNRVYANGTTGEIAGIILSSGLRNQAYNNLVYDNNGVGIKVQYGGDQSQVFNNTIHGNTSSQYPGIFILGDSLSVQVRNNLSIGNAGSGYCGNANYCNASPNTIQSTNIIAGTDTAFFTNVATKDFTLKGGIAAVDGGICLGGTITAGGAACGTNIFGTDFVGTARAQGGAWDVGAYEKTDAAGPTLTLLNPNSGTLGAVSSSQTFTWGFTDAAAVPNVKLSYDAANDGTFEVVISASTANDGAFPFTASATPTTTGRFKVEDAADGTPSDTSDSNVTITAVAGGGFTKRISANLTGAKVGDFGGVDETFIKEPAPTTNNANDYFEVSKYAAAAHTHGLLKFPGISNIPPGATISSVTLGLYLFNAGVATAQTLDIRRVLRPWTEATATWNNYDTSLAWTTAGALSDGNDRTGTASAQFTGVTSTAGYYTVTDSSGALLANVQNWANGGYANYGWHISRNGTGNDNASRYFTSSEGTDGQRPYLEVTYSTSVTSITVTQPTSGSHFFPGDSMPARWTSDGLTGNFSVEISYNGGTSYQPTPIIASHPYDQADAVWIVSGPASVGQARIRVCQGATCGESQNFTIAGTTLSIR